MKISIHYKYNYKEYFILNILFFYIFKIVPKLTPAVMADMDRILGNKPIMRVSTKGEVNFQTPIQISQPQR